MSAPYGNRLAIYVKSIGSPTQTFVQQHIKSLNPDYTVVVAWRRSEGPGIWSTACPTIILRQAAQKHRHASATREKHLVAFLDIHKIDTLFLEFFFDAAWVIPICRKRNIRCVAMGHGADVSLMFQSPEKSATLEALKLADAVVVVNRQMQQSLIEAGIPSQRLHKISCGVAFPETLPFRSQATSDPIRCISVGRMVEKKGPLLTLRAFEIAAKKDPRLHLEMVGDGPLGEALRQSIQASGLNDRVTLAGALPHAEVLQRLCKADIFLQHSLTASNGDKEGLPVAILEAMAHACPVISTRHAGIPEVITNDAQGILVEEGDIEGMAVAITKLTTDHERRRALGEAARHRVFETYTREKERDALRTLLHLSPQAPDLSVPPRSREGAPIPLIYIYSSSHSGSTLLDLILGAHPKIFGLGEMKFLSRLWREEGLPSESRLCGCGTLRQDCDFWVEVRKRLGPLDTPTPDGDPEGWEPTSPGFSERTAQLLREVQRVSKQSVLCDSSKNLARLEALAADASFNIKVVHLVRDGRAVAYSKKHRGLDYRKWLKKWENDNLNAVDRLDHLEKCNRCTVYPLRYEDLVRRPKASLSPLLQDLGVDWHLFQENFSMLVSHSLAGNPMRLRAHQAVKMDKRPMHSLGRARWLREGWSVRKGLKKFGYHLGPWWL